MLFLLCAPVLRAKKQLDAWKTELEALSPTELCDDANQRYEEETVMDDEEGMEGHDEARDLVHVITYQNGVEQRELFSEVWKNRLVRRVMADRDNEDGVLMNSTYRTAKRLLKSCANEGLWGTLSLRPWMNESHLGKPEYSNPISILAASFSDVASDRRFGNPGPDCCYWGTLHEAHRFLSRVDA